MPFPVTVTAAPRRAPGVVYSSVPDLPGVEMFRCSSWHATMSVPSCAKRWRQQRDVDVESRDACTGCAIGAAHAGVEPDRRSKIFGWPLCSRCRRRSTRMILGRLCVSCMNREYEVRKGRNSRGSKPRLVLEPKRIGLVLDLGGPAETALDVAEAAVRDNAELAIAALRVVDGAVAFTRPRGGPAIGLTELARLHGSRHGPRKPKPRRPMPRRRVMPRPSWARAA